MSAIITKPKPPHYIHLHRLEIQRVLEVIDPNANHYTFDGFSVNIHSKRLQTFKFKGIRCAKCGIEGSYFSVDRFGRVRPDSPPHLNLYAVNEFGHSVLMTHDHIIPKSKGGADELYNTQTMCVNCNVEKGCL